MRMSEDKIPDRLISPWYNKKKPYGRPNMSLKQIIKKNFDIYFNFLI